MSDTFRDWLGGLDPGLYLVLWVGSLTLMLVCLVVGFRSLIRARIITHTPTARLRSAAQGFNEIEGIGRAIDDHPLRSPLSLIPCLWFDTTIERLERNGKAQRWVTVERRRSDALFRIDDGSGEAFVDPDHARIIPHSSRRWRGRGPPRGWMAAIPIGSGGNSYRYTERLLFPDHPLYVLGWLETRGHRNEGAGVRDVVERRRLELLREWKVDKALLQRFDLDGDGNISEREWAWARRLARAQARKEVSEAERESATGSNVVHLMHRPNNGNPFIISGLSQGRLAQRKTIRAAGFIMTALVLFVFWLMLQEMRPFPG